MQQIQCLIHLTSGGMLPTGCDSKNTELIADTITAYMKTDKILRIKGPDGKTTILVRGDQIAGLSFEQVDPELIKLHKRRMRAEIKHLENMSGGESWQQGNEEED